MDRYTEHTDGPGYRNLTVWQKSIDLTVAVYKATKAWPRDELYGLTGQARRAATSIPANIAEGRGRSSPKEYLHFLSIANGSLCELETHLIVAQKLDFIAVSDFKDLQAQTTSIAQLLGGLMRRLRSPSIREDDATYE